MPMMKFGAARIPRYQSSFSSGGGAAIADPAFGVPGPRNRSGGVAVADFEPSFAETMGPPAPRGSRPLPTTPEGRARNFQNSLDNERISTAKTAGEFALAAPLPKSKIPTLAPAAMGAPATTEVYNGAYGIGPDAEKQAKAARSAYVNRQNDIVHSLDIPMSVEQMAVANELQGKTAESDAKVRATDAYTAEHTAGAGAKDAWALEYPKTQAQMRLDAAAKTDAEVALKGTQGEANKAAAAAKMAPLNPLSVPAQLAQQKANDAAAKTAATDANNKAVAPARAAALNARAERDKAAAARDNAIYGTLSVPGPRTPQPAADPHGYNAATAMVSGLPMMPMPRGQTANVVAPAPTAPARHEPTAEEIQRDWTDEDASSSPANQPPRGNSQTGLPKIARNEDYQALQSGAVYLAPDGSKRTKR